MVAGSPCIPFELVENELLLSQLDRFAQDPEGIMRLRTASVIEIEEGHFSPERMPSDAKTGAHVVRNTKNMIRTKVVSGNYY